MAIQAQGVQPSDQAEVTLLEAWLNDYIPNQLLPAVLYRGMLIQKLRADGYDNLLPADLLARHDEADRVTLELLGNLQALGEKKIAIVPYRLKGDPTVYLATLPVDKIPSELSGWFLIARLVLKFANLAAVAAAGVWIANLVTKLLQSYAQADLLKAQTASSLADTAKAMQKTDPTKAAEIATAAVAAGQAAQAAAADSGNILTRFVGGVSSGFGAMLPILLLALFAFRKGKKASD